MVNDLFGWPQCVCELNPELKQQDIIMKRVGRDEEEEHDCLK